MKVELIENMGNDLSVIRAATASFDKDPVEWDEQKHPRLINYLARGMTKADYETMIKTAFSLGGLMEDMPSGGGQIDLVERMIGLFENYRHTPTHWSPFAHPHVTLRLQAPIAIHAQCVKHAVGFTMNTVSRRYVSDMPEFFVPTFRHAPSGNVKQGSGDEIGEIYIVKLKDGAMKLFTSEKIYREFMENCRILKDVDKVITYSQQSLQSDYGFAIQTCLSVYNEMVEAGVAPEQARFVLPQGVMTEWVWTGSLYAWARFYIQRTDSHAQKEIQDLAKMVGEIIKPLYPHSWKALVRS